MKSLLSLHRALPGLMVCAALLTGCAQPQRQLGSEATLASGHHWSGRMALQVQDSQQQSFSASFELQGRPSWKKLSPVTVAKKTGNRKLQEGGERSEDLMGSFEARVEGNAAIVSNAVTYAAVHNFGHTFNRKKKDGSEYNIVIPARPFMTIPARGRQALADACADFLESLVRKS